MAEKFTPYDPAAALDSRETIEVFLNDAFETSDAVHISAASAMWHAPATWLRSRNMPECGVNSYFDCCRKMGLLPWRPRSTF
jgi:DNA-binding phage protein